MARDKIQPGEFARQDMIDAFEGAVASLVEGDEKLARELCDDYSQMAAINAREGGEPYPPQRRS